MRARKVSVARHRIGAAMGHSVIGRKTRFVVRATRFEASRGVKVR
jgi:hypothetical protein